MSGPPVGYVEKIKLTEEHKLEARGWVCFVLLARASPLHLVEATADREIELRGAGWLVD